MTTSPLTDQPSDRQVDRDSNSPLDRTWPQFAELPHFADTVTLLRCVRDHDFDTLAALCDDDFGIIDVDPSGQPRAIRTRADWEAWFHGLFATLDTMHARTDSDIVDYHASTSGDLAYSVLEFRQYLSVGDATATFDCIATIVWKRTPDGWREARWHASVIDSDVPESLRTP
jgi:ketosteroid isomerase-like protein